MPYRLEPMTLRDIPEVLEVIVRSSRQLLGARYAALGIPDEGGGFAEFITDACARLVGT